MTEKRFKWDSALGKVYDYDKPIADTFESYCEWELVDLLNELSEENEQLKQSFINLIDKKIEEFQNGDYGDLPCNTIHMFLDLKEELER